MSAAGNSGSQVTELLTICAMSNNGPVLVNDISTLFLNWREVSRLFTVLLLDGFVGSELVPVPGLFFKL